MNRQIAGQSFACAGLVYGVQDLGSILGSFPGIVLICGNLGVGRPQVGNSEMPRRSQAEGAFEVLGSSGWLCLRLWSCELESYSVLAEIHGFPLRSFDQKSKAEKSTSLQKGPWQDSGPTDRRSCTQSG